MTYDVTPRERETSAERELITSSTAVANLSLFHARLRADRIGSALDLSGSDGAGVGARVMDVLERPALHLDAL